MNLTRAQIELCIKWIEHNVFKHKSPLINDSKELDEAIGIAWKMFAAVHESNNPKPWLGQVEGTRKNWKPVYDYFLALHRTAK